MLGPECEGFVKPPSGGGERFAVTGPRSPARTYAAATVVVLVSQPGMGADPIPADIDAWDDLALTHATAGIPLLDIVLLDGHQWRSVAGDLG